MNGEFGFPRLGLLDSSLVVLYLIGLWIVALRGTRRRTGGEEYLLAGRRLTLPAFVATLVTTWYGGILGVGEFGWRFGISTWLVFGVPYYLHAIIFALFLAPLARRGGFINLPDQLERAYGRGAAVTGAAFLLVITIPAAYILMIGIMIRMIIPMPELLALLIGAALSTAYLWKGGLAAVVRTDKLQFVLMFAGFAILIAACWNLLSPFELGAHLPTVHLSWHGGNTVMYIVLWYLVAAQTYIDPTFHQRCYAAKSEAVAKKGVLISVAAWLVFDAMTTLSALYARALLPGLSDPVAAFPALAAKVLPVGLLGLFIVALFAIVMSTVDSFGFLAAVTLGRDLIGRVRGRLSSEDSSDVYVRWSLAAVGLAAVALAAWKGSVVELWKELGSISAPALLIPVVSSFWKKSSMNPAAALICIASAGGTALLWTVTAYLPGREQYLLGVEPIYPGLAVSAIVYLLDRVLLKCRPGSRNPAI